ncbi:hypothetical protein BDA96_09G098200 [Sorghum bicolor]|uniref:HMA domain-containing protein n=2 Tax=Sorghum bicolor TaxID=4558 RepID=A0A921U438_SORBI|nr:hypothetical protein BDA96_09G098200 [Sorghum bicolor]OQU91727.1 hypothetical protein SORBI_3001G237400 [Sorghum bicolor]
MAPVILSMDVHCHCCAKKIRNAVMKLPGVDSVTFGTGLLMIEGTADAATLRARLQAKTGKAVNVVISDGGSERGCRRGHGDDGRGGEPGGGHRDGRRLGGGHQPPAQGKDFRQSRQRLPETRLLPRIRPRAVEGDRSMGGSTADVWGAAGGGYRSQSRWRLVICAPTSRTLLQAPETMYPCATNHISTRPTGRQQQPASVAAIAVVRCPSTAGCWGWLLLPGTSSVRWPILGGSALPTAGQLLYDGSMAGVPST